MVYIRFFFSTLFQGRHRTHTGYRGMPHLHCFCILQLVGGTGVMSSRQRCSWCTDAHFRLPICNPYSRTVIRAEAVDRLDNI